jgi:hypothetical protein
MNDEDWAQTIALLSWIRGDEQRQQKSIEL